MPRYVTSLDENPYINPDNPPGNPEDYSVVCMLRWLDDSDLGGRSRYQLKDVPLNELSGAREEGFWVTHYGHCGACSSLQDLGIYMRNLTTPVRTCTLKSLFWNLLVDDYELNCLLDLGFSQMCATVWQWNMRNTATTCRIVSNLHLYAMS